MTHAVESDVGVPPLCVLADAQNLRTGPDVPGSSTHEERDDVLDLGGAVVAL